MRVVLGEVFAFYIAQALPRGNGVSVCFAFLYQIVYKVKVIKQLSITELVLAYIQK